MKVRESDDHNRTLHFTELPQFRGDAGLPTEMKVACNYVGNSSAANGIQIDHVVMPMILGSVQLTIKLLELREKHGLDEDEPTMDDDERVMAFAYDLEKEVEKLRKNLRRGLK